MEWQIQLVGDDWDLEWLSQQFPSGGMIVGRNEDGYFLQAEVFKDLMVAELVAKRADELLEKLNSLALLYYPSSWRGVGRNAVSHIKSDGTKEKHIFLEGRIEARSRLLGTPTVIDKNGEVVVAPLPISEAAKALEIALSDSAVGDVLKRMKKKELDFGDLYYIYERIEYDIGKKNWAKLGERFNELSRNRFTGTANNSGEEGTRHPQKGLPIPNPMTFPEAREFIFAMARQWLNQKV